MKKSKQKNMYLCRAFMLFSKIKKIHVKSNYKPMYYKVPKNELAARLDEVKKKHGDHKTEYKRSRTPFSDKFARRNNSYKYTRIIMGRIIIMSLLLGIGYMILTTDKIRDIFTYILE